MGTGIYGTKYNKSGTFGLEIDGSKIGFPSYCVIGRPYSKALNTAFELSQEGNKVSIWAEGQDCCVDVYVQEFYTIA